MVELMIRCPKIVDAEGVSSASIADLLQQGDSVVLVTDLSETHAQYRVRCAATTAQDISAAPGVEVLA